MRCWRGVRQRARPSPVARLRGDSGTHRVEIDIAQRCKQVGGIERAGKVTIVPEVPNPVTVAIQFQGVLRVCVGERERERFRASGNHNKMNVIGHQAPSENAYITAAGMLAKDLKIADTILVGEEYVLPVIAALGDVMRGAR